MAKLAPAPKSGCPICGRPAAAKTRPFCSVRCADVDLGRWFGEVYRVPAEPMAEDDAIAAPDDEA